MKKYLLILLPFVVWSCTQINEPEPQNSFANAEEMVMLFNEHLKIVDHQFVVTATFEELSKLGLPRELYDNYMRNIDETNAALQQAMIDGHQLIGPGNHLSDDVETRGPAIPHGPKIHGLVSTRRTGETSFRGPRDLVIAVTFTGDPVYDPSWRTTLNTNAGNLTFYGGWNETDWGSISTRTAGMQNWSLSYFTNNGSTQEIWPTTITIYTYPYDPWHGLPDGTFFELPGISFYLNRYSTDDFFDLTVRNTTSIPGQWKIDEMGLPGRNIFDGMLSEFAQVTWKVRRGYNYKFTWKPNNLGYYEPPYTWVGSVPYY